MATKHLIAILLLGGLSLGAGALLQSQGKRQAPAPQLNRALEHLELVDARPFVLDQSFVHKWRQERPSFQGGYLLVLRADAEFLRPRQGLEPVLYVGAETAQRLNNPTDSGYLVCLVPTALTPAGQLASDPTQGPIWFGNPELPERVDAARARQELGEALALGVAPKVKLARSFSPKGLQGKQLANSTVYMRDRDELDLIVADLIEAYSPGESERISSLRMPRSR